MSSRSTKEETIVTLKMKERSGNVYENKGPAFSSPAGSWNVAQNKGSYALKAGMLVKLQVVSVWQVVGRRWGKGRSQTSTVVRWL